MSVHKLWITFPMFLQKMRFPHKAAVVHTSYAHSVRNGGEGRLCSAGGGDADGRQIVNCALFGGIFFLRARRKAVVFFPCGWYNTEYGAGGGSAFRRAAGSARIKYGEEV